MGTKELFPARLRALREAIGVSQEEFAQALGVSRPTISYYERGERIPDIDVLDRIVRLTGCQPGYLLGYFDNMKRENVEIGHVTGLSDKALRTLRWNRPEYREVINYIVERDDFRELLNAIYMYGRQHSTAIAYGMPTRSIDEYLLFASRRIFDRIVESYKADIRDLGYQPKTDEDYVRRAHIIAERIKKKEQSLREESERMDSHEKERYEKRKKMIEEHRDNMENDPFYRFRHEMRTHKDDQDSPDDTVTDENL